MVIGTEVKGSCLYSANTHTESKNRTGLGAENSSWLKSHTSLSFSSSLTPLSSTTTITLAIHLGLVSKQQEFPRVESDAGGGSREHTPMEDGQIDWECKREETGLASL